MLFWTRNFYNGDHFIFDQVKRFFHLHSRLLTISTEIQVKLNSNFLFNKKKLRPKLQCPALKYSLERIDEPPNNLFNAPVYFS
jgi:hypothetical protein